MNKQFAAAWDEAAEFAQERGGALVREGHRFFYAWTASGGAVGGEGDTSGVVVSVWVEENMPRYGLRVGEVSARVWSLDAAGQVIAGLTG